MSTCSGLTNPHSEVSRGRTRTRRFSGQSDSGLPPSGFGMRQRQGSISSLISNKSGNELIQGLEEYRIRNREDLSREQIEAQVMKIWYNISLYTGVVVIRSCTKPPGDLITTHFRGPLVSTLGTNNAYDNFLCQFCGRFPIEIFLMLLSNIAIKIRF